MTACWCSLAGTAACRYCSNNPYAESPPTVCIVKTTTEMPADYPFFKPREEKPRTNGDSIRSMTDEELADMLVDIGECDRRCPAKLDDCIFSDSSCRSAWLDWLQQEAGE